MNEEKITTYELMYIVPTSYTEEELGGVEGHVTDVLTKNNATVASTKRLGKFRFAYPIKHEAYGHYVLVAFSAAPGALMEIEHELRLNSKEIIRHVIVTAEELGDNTYELVQFQPVSVESPDRRRSRPREEKPPLDAKKAKADQQAGVAALEGGRGAEGVEAPIAEMSKEDLEKKIDAALGEKEA